MLPLQPLEITFYISSFYQLIIKLSRCGDLVVECLLHKAYVLAGSNTYWVKSNGVGMKWGLGVARLKR